MNKPMSGTWRINREQLKRYLPSVYFYFFYGALGSLFPYLNIYYRSIGLDPWQIGLLGALRPFVALISGPLWCFTVNRYKVRKSLLILSLIGWILFTIPQGFLYHGHDFATCDDLRQHHENLSMNKTLKNYTQHMNENFQRAKRDHWEGNNPERQLTHVLKDGREQQNTKDIHKKNPYRKLSKRSMSINNDPRSVVIGKPLPNSFGLMGLTFHNKPYKNYHSEQDSKSRGRPYVNARINPYKATIFIEVFILVLLGEIFQSPTDDVNIHYDGTFLEPMSVLFKTLPKNGIYSSVGVASVAMVTGALVNFSPKYIICGKEYGDYRIAFVVFSVLMIAAFFVSMHFSLSRCLKLTNYDVYQSLKELCPQSHMGFWWIVFLMGTFQGVLSNFLHWNIIEIGGSELNVGITVICQNISDSVLALSAPSLMKYLGYIGMIFSGLASYGLRFLLYSSMTTPSSAWAIPSVELLHGFSHSIAWSAFILYIINYTPRSTYPVGIFITQGIYLGLGTTFGAVLSGSLIQSLDTSVTFRIFGLMSILPCLIFTLIQPTGVVEILPGEIDPISLYTDEDGYSSEEELLFDYRRRNVMYEPLQDKEETKCVVPSTSAPLVPTFMTFVNNRDESTLYFN